MAMTRKRKREALERRRDHLMARCAATPGLSFDAAERDALTWVLEREQRLMAVEALVADMEERGAPGPNDSATDAAHRWQIREDARRLQSILGVPYGRP